MVYGNGSFLGWTANGSVITSPDGSTWTSSGIGTAALHSYAGYWTGGWASVAYGNGKFVAVRTTNNLPGQTTPGASAVSYDNGLTWVYGYLPTVQFNTSAANFWNAIIYAGNVFVAVGSLYDSVNTSFYGVYAYSPDGVDWTASSNTTVSALFNPISNYLAYGNGILLQLYRQTGSTGATVQKSTNKGASWTTPGGSPPSLFYNSMTYGAGLFVAVGASATNTNTTSYTTTPDGVTWTTRTLPVSLAWQSITYANGFFVAVGQDSAAGATTVAVATSADGINWTSRTVDSASYRGAVAGGKGKFVYASNWGSSTGGVLINLNTAASSFSLPYVRPVPGTQTYIKAT